MRPCHPGARVLSLTAAAALAASAWAGTAASATSGRAAAPARPAVPAQICAPAFRGLPARQHPSIWAIQRDNGGCPGTAGSNTCSGLQEPSWVFSHVLEPFTG